jgi:signal transduction histidine kinase
MIRDRAFAPQLLPILAVAVAYFAAAEAAQHWLRASGNAPIVWIASGVGLAAYLLRGTAILPGVALGAFVCSLREGDGALFGAVAAAVTTAHVALSGWLLTRVFAFDVALARVRDVLALILVGATVSPLCNAAWSLVADAWRGTMPMPERLLRVQVTSLGEAVGILLLVPVLLTVIAGSASRVRGERRSEALALHAINVVVSVVVFGGLLAPSMNAQSLPYALFPITFWAAFRLGVRDTAIALLIAGGTAVACHSLGAGPFVMPGDTPASAFAHFASLYLFLAVLTVTSLLAAAAQGEGERARASAREHLEALAHVSRVASMGEMASAIAHEINQPLTAIANYAAASLRLMKAGRLPEAEALDTLARLAAEAERAGEIVRKMRGFVRGEEGHPAAIAVDELVADVQRLSGPEARQHDVDLVVAAPAGLPPVRADAIQIQQVLINLVRNAIEAMSAARTATRRIELSAQAGPPGTVEIRVRDTGPGLPDGDLEQVFAPFFTTKPDGIGIGLALSRSIVDAHGGRLWATAAAPGASFHLTLPIDEEAHAAA